MNPSYTVMMCVLAYRGTGSYFVGTKGLGDNDSSL